MVAIRPIQSCIPTQTSRSLVLAEISLFVGTLFPADRRVYILLEKMTENDRVAESFPFWLYQLGWRFCQVFEKVSVDLSLACELRATLLCALGRELNQVPGIRLFRRYQYDRINR
jgi:hypothetical protein